MNKRPAQANYDLKKKEEGYERIVIRFSPTDLEKLGKIMAKNNIGRAEAVRLAVANYA